MKKKSLVLIIFVLVSMLSVWSIVLRYNTNDKVYGISVYKIYKNQEIKLIIDDMYIIDNGNILEVKDKDDNRYFYINEEISGGKKVSSGYLLYSKNKTYIIDNDKNLVKEVEGKVQEFRDVIKDNIYYVSDNKIYDINGELVYSKDNLKVDMIADELIYTNKEVYNFKDEVIDNYSEIVEIGKYYLVNGSNKLIDSDTKLVENIKEFKIKNNRYQIELDNKVLKIDSQGNIIDDIDIIKNNMYVMDASSCDDGWILENNQGKLLYDKCSTYDVYDDFYVVDKKIYNYNGELLYNNEVNLLEKIDDNRYILDNNIVDNKLNILGSYDDIECRGKLCITLKDSRYGIYYEGEEKINNIFYELVLNENKVIVKDIAFDAVIYFDLVDEEKSINEIINLKNSYYEEMDIKQVLEKYSLDIEVIDEIFFKKYAYVVEHSLNIDGYKDKVYNLYKAIIDNKKYIDEDYLLYNLKKLKIIESSSVSIYGAAGVYKNGTKTIELLKKDEIKPAIYYHELYHFIDYNVGYRKKIELDLPNTQFIMEAGAELYSVKYFLDNGMVRAYRYGTYVYEVMNYIFSNEVMERIYYSPNTDYELYKLLVLDYKIPYENYEEIVKTFNKLTTIKNMNNREVLDRAIEWLEYINDVVKKEKSEEFTFYMSIYSQIDDNRYSQEKEFSDNILLEIDDKINVYNIKDIHIVEDGTIIYFEVLDNNSIMEYIRILYSFEDKRIIEYERIEGV